LVKGNLLKQLFLLVVFLAVVFFLDLVHVLVQAQEEDAQQVIKLIQESTAALKDVSASVTQSNQTGGISISFSGTLRFKSPDKVKANIEIFDGSGNKLKSLSVYDGNVLWQEQTDANSGKIKVFKSIMQGSTPQAREFMKQFNPKEQLQSLMSDYSVISVNSQGEAGSLVYILELEIKPQVRQRMIQRLKAFSNSTKIDEHIPDRAILSWDTNTQHISKLHMFSKNQELQIITTYANTKRNAGIEDAAFIYKPSEGANIIDMSEAMAEEIVQRELEGAENELVGSTCPAFSLPDIFGKQFSSDILRGKVVIINFWEHWCPPCKKELPFIENLFQSVFEEEVQVLTITSDAEATMRVVDENGYFFPVLIDKEAKLAKQLKVLSIPRTFVVDSHGVIRAVYIGYHENIKDILTEAINQYRENED